MSLEEHFYWVYVFDEHNTRQIFALQGILTSNKHNLFKTHNFTYSMYTSFMIILVWYLYHIFNANFFIHIIYKIQ